jgi:diketogulonate reductase-like aldo/keto reductase
MNQLTLKSGRRIAALGLGTWRLGESRARAEHEVAALRGAIDLGYRVFDTAEMYGEGGAERVLGRAINEALRSGTVAREEIFVVSKVYPHNAHRRGTLRACDASRRRLALDQIDLYLLHWRGSHPLEETVGAFEDLATRGAIGQWGVSNFDVDDLDDLWQAEGRDAAGTHCMVNQVYYSLATRGVEFSLKPLMERAAMPLMAYTPIDQGKLGTAAALKALASARGVSAAQLALAWLLQRPGVIAIPKAINPAHLRENLDAAELTLTDSDLAALDAAFPPPKRKSALAVI